MMRSTFWRNLFWLGSTTVGSMVASFLYGLLAARYLGPVDFGRYALVVGVGSWVISLAQGGGTTAILVLAAQERRRASQLLWPGIVIQAGVGAMAILVSLPAVWILSQDVGLLWPSVIYGLANIAYLIISVPISIYRGLDRMEWGLALTAVGLGTVLLMIGVMALDLGFEAIIAANAVSQIVVLVIVFPLARRGLSGDKEAWNPKMISRLWFTSIALWGVTILQSLHWRVGLVATQVLAGSYEVGLYTAAAKLVENLRAMPWLLLMAVLPIFVQVGQTNRDELGTLMRRALRYVLLIAFPLGAVLAVLSPFIIGLFYTPDYAPSTRVFLICAFGLVPLFAHWVFLSTMVSLHLERELMITYLISIVAEVTLDGLLVPVWGASGAAAGYVAGECLAALISGLYVARTVGALGGGDLLRIVAPGLLSLAAVWLPLAEMNRFVWAAIVCVVYILGLFLFKAITPSELRSLVGRRPVRTALDSQ